ncbi:MAG: cob(I)yrinic acid a,c-diamide adenosyltransferase [Candidatus Dormibacteria bacterium]
MKKHHLGDEGRTRLMGGQEVSKSSWRPTVYGGADEASSVMGLARALLTEERLRDMIREAQADLYVFGAEIASTADEAEKFGFRIEDAAVERLERQMAELIAERPLPTAFVLPGSTEASAQLDVARTVVRRCERDLVAAIEAGELAGGSSLRFLNRLSDLLFVIARHVEGDQTELAIERREGARARRSASRAAAERSKTLRG